VVDEETMMSVAPFRLGTVGVLLAGVLAAGCGQAPVAKKDKVVEVIVTTPISDEVVDYQDFTGRLDGYRTVEVRSRVTGYVEDAPFKEGDRVKKGDVLFRIDARTFKADLAQAEGNLGLAIADRDYQAANFGRAKRMAPNRVIGREEFDLISANRSKAEATVRAMTAARDRAAINLDYCDVRSPISGRISRRYVDPGNLVKADDTMLTTVVADEPIYAYFDVDERTYLDLAGEKPSSSPSARLQSLHFPVLMRLANEDDFVHQGDVDFLDNRLNGNTGTIRMRGVFKNPHGTLKAGLFIRVRLPIGSAYRSLLVPDEALQSDQGRKYVYLVKKVTQEDEDGNREEKDVVEYRRVEPGQAIGGLRVIKALKKDRKTGKILEGIEPGERVIISGMQRVRSDLAVTAKMQRPPKSPGSPISRMLNQKRPDSAVGRQNDQSGHRGG
jgi:RND family efflux transporter MFP subunit